MEKYEEIPPSVDDLKKLLPVFPQFNSIYTYPENAKMRPIPLIEMDAIEAIKFVRQLLKSNEIFMWREYDNSILIYIPKYNIIVRVE